MDKRKMLNWCIKQGILLDSETLNLFSEEVEDLESAKLILERIQKHTRSNIITKNFLENNKQKTQDFFLTLPEEKQKKLEKLKIKLGLSIEISKEVSPLQNPSDQNQKISETGIKVLSKTPVFKKKVEVKDFVKNFRHRFVKLRNILQEHSELSDLVSINKLPNSRKKVSIIGLISEKRVTKNKNLLLEVEDLTGKTRVLINNNKPDLFEEAENLSLDSVIGFTGFGDRQILFANNIVFPEAVLFERKKSPNDENAVFISDLHYGSKLFFEDNFKKFINYLNGKTKNSFESDRIKYLFITGDLIAGVGVYPGQKKDLKIEDIESQFQGFAELIGKIRRNIKVIISPGNHDGVRLMEPQPVLDEKYAWPLYNLKNVILTGNPSYVNIGAEKDFSGLDVLTYHGFSYPYYANNVQKLLEKGLNAPEEIMRYLLKHRHLAPAHSSIQALPSEEDGMVIDKIPDIFVSGHTHKCSVSHYNNILLVSNASWEDETENQRKKGVQQDVCKVPLFNLKSRAVKILDFGGKKLE